MHTPRLLTSLILSASLLTPVLSYAAAPTDDACALVAERKQLQTTSAKAQLAAAQLASQHLNQKDVYSRLGYRVSRADPPDVLDAKARARDAENRLDAFVDMVKATHGGVFPTCATPTQ